MTTEQYKIIVTIDGQNHASASIDKVNKDLNKMDDSLKKTSSGWSKFKDAAGTALGAIGIAGGIAAAVGQINELGRAANAAELTFNQVSGGVDRAAASLARMRDMTGHVIDDMSLMKGASSLLVTGIAETNEQAEGLVNLGARLSSVMGVDAAEGIANLNSALLNNSFLRLDTLGISASRVRERVNELKQAGLDMSEAFAQAVTEIGTQTLEDLGEAANVAETAVGRLQTKLENMAQNTAQWVNVQLETAATTLEQLFILGDLALGGTGGIPALEAERAAYDELIASAEEYKTKREQLFAVNNIDVVDSGFSTQEAQSFVEANPAMSEQLGSGTYFQAAFGSFDPEKINEARMVLAQLRPEWAALTDEQLRMYSLDIDNTFLAVAEAGKTLENQTRSNTIALQAQNMLLTTTASVEMEYLKNAAKGYQDLAWSRSQASNAIPKDVKGGSSGGWSRGGMDAQTDTLSRYVALQDEAANGLGRMSNEADLLNGIFAQGKQITEDLVYFSPTQLGLIEDRAANLTSEYERLLQIQETNPELVTQEEVDRAAEIANSAESMASDAMAMAEAWENASLAQMAGQGDGGRLDEFYQGVLGQIEDPELRAQAEEQFNLTSGVETANSRVIEWAQSLNAAIVEEFGSGRGAQLGQEIAAALETGMSMGLQGEALQDFVEEQVGYALGTGMGGGGQEVTVQAGEGYIALAERTGIAREDLEAATGGGMLQVGQVITVGDGTTLIAVNGSPEDLAAASIGNIFGNAQSAISGGMSNGISSTSITTPNASFSYYDPMTGQVTEDTTQASQPLVPPEQGELVNLMAEDMLTIETSMTNIAAIDTTVALDPMIEDVQVFNAGITEAKAGLDTLSAADYSIEMPIRFVFDTQTADMLARNPTIIETIRLVLPQVGVTSSE